MERYRAALIDRLDNVDTQEARVQELTTAYEAAERVANGAAQRSGNIEEKLSDAKKQAGELVEKLQGANGEGTQPRLTACLEKNSGLYQQLTGVSGKMKEASSILQELAAMCAWVVSTDRGAVASQEEKDARLQKFKAEFEDHFVKAPMLFYYLFTEVFLMVDSRAKNFFPTTFDGQHWLPFPYDFDTAIGINNEGQLVFDYDLEDTDRTYTVRFYNGSTLLQTVTNVKYGGSASYTGSTPVSPDGSAEDYPFEGWLPLPTNIQGNTDCKAQFGSPLEVREIEDSWEEILADGSGMAPLTWCGIELLKTSHRWNPNRIMNEDGSYQEGTGAVGGCGMQLTMRV